MSALVLPAHMERLMLRHGQELSPPPELPLVDTDDHAVIVEGLASTGDRDAEFCVFAPYAFGDLDDARPPLLLEHDHAKPAAGSRPSAMTVRPADGLGLCIGSRSAPALRVFGGRPRRQVRDPRCRQPRSFSRLHSASDVDRHFAGVAAGQFTGAGAAPFDAFAAVAQRCRGHQGL